MAGNSKANTESIEKETQAIGKMIWENMERSSPSFFETRWWDNRILSWAMEDESVKVQMFRFVDVLPMLQTHDSVCTHLQEYFEDVRKHLPLAVRVGLEMSQPNTILGKAIALNARSNALRMANRFIAGSTVNEVRASIIKLRKQNYAFTLDLLGESVLSETEEKKYLQSYLELIEGLSEDVNSWSENYQTDCDHEGPIPRINVSLKLSSLYSQFNPAAPEETVEEVCNRLRPLLRSVRENNAFLNIDMEQYDYKDITLRIFREILMEKEFRDFSDIGIVIQAYLLDSENDLKELLAWVKKRKTPVWVRLVKGAYWDYETIVAQKRNWPVPVFQQKWKTDQNFEKLTEFLMENYIWLRPAIASHNLRSLSHGMACVKEFGLPEGACEFQVLYGMGGDTAEHLSQMGHRVRVYTPFGELIPGMAYLVRRLLENTSNDSFLRQSVAENVDLKDLLMSPAEVGELTPEPEEKEITEFQNEPVIDFSQNENREALKAAMDDVRDQFGKEYDLIIGGRAIQTRGTITSRNPSNQSEIIGQVGSASAEDAVDAIDVARRTFRQWSTTEVEHRAEYLELIAAEMRIRRLELISWIVFETGKTWAEADADVAEAIDFCMYYADQMQILAEPLKVDLSGEENRYYFRARGVCVVIAPWNFPLAILTGMTVAAMVTGNTVIMKPAEQSSVVAAKLMDIIHDVGVPDGVVNYLPGVGEEVGPELVGSPDVDLIAFTGSREVGLEINLAAAQIDDRQTAVRRVIAEMGGKNAIIIDDDADLDEAVMGVIHSAFGYSGQKCSACSRVIILKPIYDAFVERLVEATKSMKIGPAEDPSSKIGPVIDEDARTRILEYIETGQEEGELILSCSTKELVKQGSYVGPHIFANVDPESTLAQEEIFGPVLTLFKVKSINEAIQLANNTDYALTAGIFSRSPANLEIFKRDSLAGNLYLNREITGAMVHRQPFGGFKMSGIGSKTGSPDYLQQFLIPVNVTENTMRRGFVPAKEESDSKKKTRLRTSSKPKKSTAEKAAESQKKLTKKKAATKKSTSKKTETKKKTTSKKKKTTGKTKKK